MATNLYSEIEPYENGLLDVGDGNLVYWETCGNPSGIPAVVVHGGPGSGCTPYFRRFFNPREYRVVLFDQRNCGRSRPHASEPTTNLARNTTHNLLSDMELLRQRLGIQRWLVLGGSWGSTLSLAYAETQPDRVTELILFGVTTGRHSEIDWAFRGGLAKFFPEQWDRLVGAVPPAYRGADIVDAYDRWLNDRTLKPGGARPKSGAHASPRPRIGHRRPDLLSASRIPLTHSPSHASSLITSVTTCG